MHVTFDTNTLDRAVRPDRFPKDPHLSKYERVHTALTVRKIEGVFSETIVTIEGIKRSDRSLVFDSTRIRQQCHEPIKPGDEDGLVIHLDLFVEQPGRKSLDPEFAARVSAALQLGLRMLAAPRVGSLHIEDPDKAVYVQETEDALGKRLEKYHEALQAIEQRGLGSSQLKAMAADFALRDGAQEPWYLSLQRAKGIHEERAIERAFAEWSDADSIAAHIGYGIDLFCTEDSGGSAGAPSVFDATNRAWLTKTYNVRFISLSELAGLIY